MTQTRFGMLDTLRGVAALAVVAYHVDVAKMSPSLLPRAYLAVDFFFILSGFVIAYTYEPKLRAGMSAAAFLMRRVVRLYPMALLAVCLGGAVLLLKLDVDPSKVDPLGRDLAGLAANLLLLPTPFGGAAARGVLFPGNPPLWSIFFELAVNVVWCCALMRLSTRTLIVMVCGCFAALAVSVTAAGTANIGFDWQTATGGLARIGFGFGLGVILYRLRDRLILTQNARLKGASLLLLLAGFVVPHQYGPVVDLVCIGLIMPLVVILGLNGSDHGRLDDTLGELSYPIYAIHFPILLLASGLHQKMPALPLPAVLTGTALAMALATWSAMRFYDAPVRRYLAGVWARHEGRVASTRSRVDPAPQPAPV